MSKKKIKQICEHINWDNERDCSEDAEYVCMCCGVPVCQEHKDRECPYGGMSYIEIEN